MNKNIIKTLILCLCLSLQSCAQNKNESTNTNTQMKEIPYKEQGMLFKLKYEHANCSYEILVNDMPVMIHFGLEERSGLTVNINQYILKPGKQDLTIRMFPTKKSENVFESKLNELSIVNINIQKKKQPISPIQEYDAELNGIKLKWDILTYQTPKLEKEVPYAEFKTSFNVDPKDINWDIIGWSESQNLKNDPNIRKEVDAFYEDFKKTLEDGNQEKYTKMLENSIYEDAASMPWDKEGKKQITKQMTEYAGQKRNFIYPCTNSELKFYGDGRVVTLVCMDTLTFGYSPLISKSEKSMLPKAHTFYLHKPKGSNKLEIIR